MKVPCKEMDEFFRQRPPGPSFRTEMACHFVCKNRIGYTHRAEPIRPSRVYSHTHLVGIHMFHLLCSLYNKTLVQGQASKIR